MTDSIETTEIIVFVSFRSDLASAATTHGSRQPLSGLADENGRLIPTESDQLLSALEPFRDCPAARVRVHDLGTSGGRLRGMLNGIFETPAVIVAGERYLGLADSQAILRELGHAATRQAYAAETPRHQKGVN
jgi:hypothetical protein